MKFATVLDGGTPRLAFLSPEGQGLIPLDEAFAAAGQGAAPQTMKALIAGGVDVLEKVRRAMASVQAGASVSRLTEQAIRWLPPIPDPSKFIGVAMNNNRLNNTAHVEPAGPMFFLKPSSCLIGHKENIEIADDYGFTFPELELGVVIGKKARRISEADALDYVFGYMVVNDITSQGLKHGDSIAVDITPQQKASPGYADYFTWRNERGEDDMAVYFTYHARSKGADTFGPTGPYITTADEIANPDALVVRGYADGEEFASDTTANYSYPVRRILAHASRYFTLQPGDIITCGTAARGNDRFPRAHHEIDMSRMTPVVDVEIEGLGRLSNRVVHI
ncbi:fumarylacetoacetate hydrolase family protein [Sphingobium sp.]|uniref:fumarylacetoacetate hydrolase family protein n=1 Tax=Sphingobium sp. TaxID=1912891 RepID=UPI0028BDBAF0|nr:fumarylacetoacetate hydrolase family protein [Sphingobium sp.]